MGEIIDIRKKLRMPPVVGHQPEFGKAIAAFRRQQDVSQERLAEAAGCSRETITAIEAGTFRPSMSLVRRIENALGLAPGTLSEPFVDGEIKRHIEKWAGDTGKTPWKVCRLLEHALETRHLMEAACSHGNPLKSYAVRRALGLVPRRRPTTG